MQQDVFEHKYSFTQVTVERGVISLEVQTHTDLQLICAISAPPIF